MVCDICGKNEATVHLTEIINNEVTKLHLCEDCAREKASEMEEHFGLAELLAGLADFGVQVEPDEMTKVKCHNCGFTFMDFKRIGRLGCAECYDAFKKNLVPLLKRLHGSDQHYGKAPSKAEKVVKIRDELQDLRAKLQKAIETEEFEEAAELRDQIKELEKKMTRKRNNEDR